MNYQLIRSKRKTVAIQIKQDGTIQIKAPNRLPLRYIEQFLREKQGWIRQHVYQMSQSVSYTHLAINLVLHNDPQKVLNTGVNDTMLDMIVCLIGALFLAICMYFYYQKGKKEFFMRTFEIFCIKNIQRK